MNVQKKIEEEAELYARNVAKFPKDVELCKENATRLINFGYSLAMGEGGYAYQISDCQLLLKPLSEMSDEDAVEVAKLAGFDKCSGRNLRVTPTWDGLGWEQSIDLDEMQIIDHCYSRDYESYYPIDNVIAVIDYLRSRGYALPYKGQCLFQSGIAINSSENKEV